MLQLLDLFFSLLHLLIIGFNLFGWIWKSTRKLHLIFVAATAFSWVVLGIWFGFGYCPITDWQWQVKEKLGETGLPNSFIKYFADKIYKNDISSSLVDLLTVIGFGLAVLLSFYTNFMLSRKLSIRK